MDTNFLTFKLDQLTYNIRPLNLSDPTHLRCVVSITNKNGYMYLDKLDLYQANSRRVFIKKAVIRMETSAQVLEQDIMRLIDQLEKLRTKEEVEPVIEIPSRQKKEALEYLQHPDLINNIVTSFHKCGYVGEDLNLLTVYLVATSRKLQFPLSLMIMSRSGAGKSTIQDAVLKFMPEEECQCFTRITDQVFFYKGKDELRHKLIAIEEIQGARGASYSLRNLLTSHGLSVNSTIKDPLTGMMRAMSHKVYGPIALILTTTCIDDIDYELLNRFIITTVDESQEQTQRILARQRQARSLEGIIVRRNNQAEQLLHQNIQRLLKPIEIVNPYYDKLKFNHKSLIMRREHLHYLGLIEAVTLLHQYQRPIKIGHDEQGEFEYIEVTPRDIEIANKIAGKVLTRSHDELLPPVRNLHKELISMTNNNGAKFTRREIREHTGWSDYQIKTYLRQLVDLEYVGIISGGGKGNKCEYELLYQGNGNKPMELIDVNLLQMNS